MKAERRNHNEADADESKEGCRDRTHPMLLSFSYEICSSGPHHKRRESLVRNAEIAPCGREVHLAEEERYHEYRQTDEQTLHYRLLVVFEEVSKRKAKTPEGCVS